MESLNRIRARYLALDPLRADAIVAAFLVAAWTAELLVIDVPEDESRPLTWVIGLAAFAALPWRRRDPLLVCSWFIAVAIAQNVAPASYFFDITTTPFAVFLLLSYTLGRHTAGWRTAAGVAVLFFGLNLAIVLSQGGFEGAEFPFALLFVIGPLLVGRGTRNRARLQAEQRGKALEAERRGRRQAERAVELERGRIAGELQAVIANGVSAMVVQAESVPALIARRDGVQAQRTLATVEETGRDTLAEMRRLLGVLRRDDETALLAPQPSLERAEALSSVARERGLDVSVEVEGERRELAPGIDLSAYRALEAALDGALEAGAAGASVRVRYLERAVELEVADDRDEPGLADAELEALRSRLAIYGGRLVTAQEDGGFVVRAILPREPR